MSRRTGKGGGVGWKGGGERRGELRGGVGKRDGGEEGGEKKAQRENGDKILLWKKRGREWSEEDGVRGD